MALKRIRLELARTKEFPDGNSTYGYEFRAPLRPDGHIDADTWSKVTDQCTVRHFRPDEDDEDGELIRTENGAWAFSYAPGEDDDEPLFRLEGHVFKEGEYVSITGHDGQVLPFKVVSVR
jgi:hypothetical protein